MKIVYIVGNMAHYDLGLSVVVTRMKEVFAELECDALDVDLGVVHPPHFDGEATGSMDNIVGMIAAADALVFASTAQFFAPTALMLSFMEYFSHPSYAAALADKRCFVLMLSENGGEKSAIAHMVRIIEHLGGYVLGQMGLATAHITRDAAAQTLAYAEKAIEDFYRALRAGRSYIVPQDYPWIAGPQPIAASLPMSASNLSPAHEEDIDELSRLFSQKFSTKDALAADTLQFSDTVVPPPRQKTTRQITASLPHYFKPQLSAGLKAAIQISISGNEAFEGTLYIHSTECTYTEGTAPAPDLVIMADTGVWADVLKGRLTAQKAFMIGGIKVRGDFVLLTRFDSLFRLEAT